MIGVLLLNLGTPDAPDAASVRRYLAEFLSDRRVIEIPPLLWQPILRGIVLRTRPAKSARAYQEVWTDEGSPLLAISVRQADRLRERLGDDINVGLAFRYGKRSVAAGISKMVDAGVDRILFAPLYPQYCGATTASSNDALFAQLATMRSQPAVRTLPPYFDDPLYIQALRANLSRQLEALDFEPQKLLLSFHGMPERTRQLGDPYYDQCMATARLLGGALGYDVDVAFQSRFGRAKWLGPATDQTVKSLAKRGVKNMAVITPGFSADCLETLEEIAVENAHIFKKYGGQNFAAIPCLNDSGPGMLVLWQMALRELKGWI